MPDLLLEFFSEEIPARMQARAAEDLKKLVTDKLVAAGLTYDGAKAFATPRRLALAVAGIPVRQPDVKEERKGPKVGAPEQAIAGFLRAAGLASIDQAKVQPDKKGDFYVAVIEKAGKPAIEVIAGIVPEVAKAFPWPKAMRWGEASAKPGALNWVRPLHSIVAMFGPETEEPDVVPFDVGGVTAGDTTYGHRFLSPGPIKVRRLDDYVAKLDVAKVVVDPARRAQMILTDAKTLAFAQGLELVEDEGLLAEVAGLVEWPVVLMGSFDKEFLAIPEEVIRATIRNNQKCFVVRDPKTARLTNKFILTSNIEASDGGKAIVAGCERVIRARLSDAKFFYETDLTTRLEDRLPKFEHIVFHEKLGTQAARIARIERLAGKIAGFVNADPEKTKRAARLAKADLLTEVVGEFPELQGLMGKYYSLAQNEDKDIAAACEEHYKPVGPSDRVPTDPISVAVALADKIDQLECFWILGEKPTGSKDPYALRRAALGVVRIILEGKIRIKLTELLYWAGFPIFGYLYWTYTPKLEAAREIADIARRLQSEDLEVLADRAAGSVKAFDADEDMVPGWTGLGQENAAALLAFFADRLKVQLREQGARHDLVDAVFALNSFSTSPVTTAVVVKSHCSDETIGSAYERGGFLGVVRFLARQIYSILFASNAAGDRATEATPSREIGLSPSTQVQGVQDDLVLVVRRIEALAKFLDTDDGKNLLAGTKRAANILRIEEKKDNTSYTGAPDATLLSQAEEKELARAIAVAKTEADAAVAKDDFASAMTAMSKLRPHVDAFFDKVTVNVDDKPLRANRLRLLNEIREATRAVADFSKIEGG